MRLVFASDTHDRHHRLVVPDGDVFVHCGDFTMNGDLAKIRAFGTWMRALPHRHKIVIAGNHDLSFQDAPQVAQRALHGGEDGLIYLEDSGVVIDGIAIWGSPWQPWFYDWAFNLRRGPEIAAKWRLIPAHTDVLVTHGPPSGILDAVHGDHVGCADLFDRVQDLRPSIHAFGHIHEGAGTEKRNGTTFVNASICDADYEPNNPVRVVDI